MSSISAVGSSAAMQMLSAQQPVASPAQSAAQPVARSADGDTPAQEAMESRSSKQAEKLNGGFAPNAANLVDKTA